MILDVTVWVKNIILVVLFASFLELLLPDSGMQRFVRVVMGLLVMLTILNPVADLVQRKYSPPAATVLTGGGGGKAEQIVQKTGHVTGMRERVVMETYKKELAQQIKAVAVATDGVAEARVAVDIKEAVGGKPGVIEKITVYVLPGNTGNKIKPVTVEKQSGGIEDEIPAELKAKLAGTIKELYQLQDGQVSIKRMI